MTDRREEFIAANADFFAARNCHLRLVPIEFAKTERDAKLFVCSTTQRAVTADEDLAECSLLGFAIFRMAPSADRYGKSVLFDYRNLRRIRAACPRQTLCNGESETI